MRTILTTRQVAKELGVTLGSVYNYIRAGILKATKPGGFSKRRHWRIKASDLREFIDGDGAERTGDTAKDEKCSATSSEQSSAPADQEIK